MCNVISIVYTVAFYISSSLSSSYEPFAFHLEQLYSTSLRSTPDNLSGTLIINFPGKKSTSYQPGQTF